jgi:fructokinase
MSHTHRRPKVLCFGEVLWDCFPDAQRLGGAPFNVAYHLQKLGCESILVSAVGADRLGEETFGRMSKLDLSTALVARHPHLPTGMVEVKLDAAGQPAYRILPDVAWDYIPVDHRVLKVVGGCDALVYGTLAARSPANRAALNRLLQVPDARRILDVNLRHPYDDHDRVLELCRGAHVLKLNEDELGQLTGISTPTDEPPLIKAIESFSTLVRVKEICVTRGARGAVFWREGRVFRATAPSVQIQNTVGAGDAFTAALTAGLLADDSDEAVGNTLQRACALGALVASVSEAQPDYDSDIYR